jgi:hypothetical protein
MTPAAQALSEGFQTQLATHGRTLTVVSGNTSESFAALVDPQPAIDPRTELGEDPRELVLIEVYRSQVPESLLAGDACRNQFVTDENGQMYEVLRRNDNPGDENCVSFWAVKRTTQDN